MNFRDSSELVSRERRNHQDTCGRRKKKKPLFGHLQWKRFHFNIVDPSPFTCGKFTTRGQGVFFFFFSCLCFFSSPHKNQVLFRSLAKLPGPTVPIIPVRAQGIGLLGLHRLCFAVRCGLCPSTLFHLARKYLYISLTRSRFFWAWSCLTVFMPAAGSWIAGLPGTPGCLAENQETVSSPLRLCSVRKVRGVCVWGTFLRSGVRYLEKVFKRKLADLKE